MSDHQAASGGIEPAPGSIHDDPQPFLAVVEELPDVEPRGLRRCSERLEVPKPAPGEMAQMCELLQLSPGPEQPRLSKRDVELLSRELFRDERRVFGQAGHGPDDSEVAEGDEAFPKLGEHSKLRGGLDHALGPVAGPRIERLQVKPALVAGSRNDADHMDRRVCAGGDTDYAGSKRARGRGVTRHLVYEESASFLDVGRADGGLTSVGRSDDIAHGA